jgi:hypothetical protein
MIPLVWNSSGARRLSTEEIRYENRAVRPGQSLDQNLDNQLEDLRRYVAQRGWSEAIEYSHRGEGAVRNPPSLAACGKLVAEKGWVASG